MIFQQAAAVLPLSNASAQMVEARTPLPVGRGTHSSTRSACQNPPYTYPRIPRPVIRQGNTSKATLDSQFQLNASHVQQPLSLVSKENREQSTLVSPALCGPMHEDERQPDTRSSSSSYEQFKSNRSFLKQESPFKRSRRQSPPTDSEDEDPFHFDNILSSPPSKRDNIRGRTLSSSLLRRASIVPVDPSAAPTPHRFSLLREHASEGTIFVQEICDAEGRRWSLRVPASGLPGDMVGMLEELENLALELGQALPRIVVTCSGESLSSTRAALTNPAAEPAAELPHPPPTTTVNVTPEEYDAIGGGYSLAKEKCRLIEPEPEPVCNEEPAKSSATSISVIASSPSEQILTCIYLPELAPEFLSGSSTSPVLQPADGFHSKPPAPATTSAHSSRQRAFFAALRDKEPVRSTRSGIARRLVVAAAAAARPPAEAKDAPAAPPAAPRSRIPMKSALPVLKARSTARTATAPPSEFRSPDPTKAPLSRRPGYGGPAMPPPGAHAAAPAPAIAATGKPPFLANVQQQANGDRGGGGGVGGRVVDKRRSIPAAATPTPAAPAPSSARKLKHFFRRPPTRSASDPPAYASVREAVEGGAKRPASEVVQAAPREVVERSRMPRLPSARDLIRKLT